jgi:hypothetical protein
MLHGFLRLARGVVIQHGLQRPQFALNRPLADARLILGIFDDRDGELLDGNRRSVQRRSRPINTGGTVSLLVALVYLAYSMETQL